MAQLKSNTDEIRHIILEAAGARFRQFGYGKTTMAEIAEDSGMSAANLYRYFENKHEIGSAMACQCLRSKSQVLLEVVENKDLTANTKIKEFILASLRYTHGQWSNQPRMSELVEAITQSRSDVVGEHLSQVRTLLARIISEGVVSGEFEVVDVESSADAALAAMFIFDYPNLMGLYPLELFEDKARGVADLLVNGLRKC